MKNNRRQLWRRSGPRRWSEEKWRSPEPQKQRHILFYATVTWQRETGFLPWKYADINKYKYENKHMFVYY